MPRRWLKDRYRTSDRLNAVSAEARDCWTRLFVSVDDFGCFTADAQLVASHCYPRKPDAAICARLLADLERARLIGVYRGVDGKLYLYLAQWDERARTAPKYEAMPDGFKESLDGAGRTSLIQSVGACAQSAVSRPQSAESCGPRARADVTDTDTDTDTTDPAGSGVVVVPPVLQGSTPKAVHARGAAQRVFDYWRVATKHDGAKLTDKRRRLIDARLKDGYSEEQLCAAIDGCKASTFHQGGNDRGAVFDDIELICRTGEKLESFIDHGQRKPAARLSLAGQQTVENLRDWQPPQPKEARDGTHD